MKISLSEFIEMGYPQKMGLKCNTNDTCRGTVANILKNKKYEKYRKKEYIFITFDKFMDKRKKHTRKMLAIFIENHEQFVNEYIKEKEKREEKIKENKERRKKNNKKHSKNRNKSRKEFNEIKSFLECGYHGGDCKKCYWGKFKSLNCKIKYELKNKEININDYPKLIPPERNEAAYDILNRIDYEPLKKKKDRPGVLSPKQRNEVRVLIEENVLTVKDIAYMFSLNITSVYRMKRLIEEAKNDNRQDI